MTSQLNFQSPLAYPKALPLLGVETLLPSSVFSPILVVAPHPDDETLGCGGAIALLRQLAQSVHVLVVSDGAQFHPHFPDYPTSTWRQRRESETLAALKLLGVDAEAVTFLGYLERTIPSPEDAEFEAAIARCRAYLQALAPSLIFLPWRSDPHRDYRAVWKLIRRASADLPNLPRQIEYPIWEWKATRSLQVPPFLKAWRLDISPVWELKQQAIAQYCSPDSSSPTPPMRNNFAQPWEVFFSEQRSENRG